MPLEHVADEREFDCVMRSDADGSILAFRLLPAAAAQTDVALALLSMKDELGHGPWHFEAASDRCRQFVQDERRMHLAFAKINADRYATAAERFDELARQHPAEEWAELASPHRRTARRHRLDVLAFAPRRVVHVRRIVRGRCEQRPGRHRRSSRTRARAPARPSDDRPRLASGAAA